MLYHPNLPKLWNEDLAYFCGLILGDGSLPKAYSKRPNGKIQKRYIIHFFCNSDEFVKDIYIPIFKKLFEINPRIIILKKKHPLYVCTIESKELYLFLERRGITTGKKAKIAKIPKLPSKYQLSLLAGLLDTDGGKKGNGFGLSTASNNLGLFCEEMFKKLNFSYHSCPWYYNNHKYHQIYVHKKDFPKILKSIPLKHKDKINFINASVAQLVEHHIGT